MILNGLGIVSTPPTIENTSKMSAIQMIIANIQSLNDAERAQVLGHFAKGTVVPAPLKEVGANKELEPKKQNANKGRPTCHGDFVKKILEEQKEAAQAFKDANKEMKGAHLIFVANYKKENAEEFAAFETSWKEAHPKVEAAPKPAADDVATVVSEVPPTPEVKAKRAMTDEQKVKMKAGREAAKAKKEADAARVVAVSTMAELMGHGEVPDDIAALAATPELKKRGPKKLEAMTSEERAKHDAKKAERQAKKAADKAAGRPTVDTDSGSDASAPSVPSARSASPKLKDE